MNIWDRLEGDEPHAEQKPKQHRRISDNTGRNIVAVIAAIVVALLYFGGTFDRALVNVGLNAKPCYQNGFGAVFCGADYDDYRARMEAAGVDTSSWGK